MMGAGVKTKAVGYIQHSQSGHRTWWLGMHHMAVSIGSNGLTHITSMWHTIGTKLEELQYMPFQTQ